MFPHRALPGRRAGPVAGRVAAVRSRRAWLRQERGAGVRGDRDGPVPAGRRDVVVLLVAVQRVVVPVRWPRLLLAAGAAADERETPQDAAHGADGLDHVFLSFFLFFLLREIAGRYSQCRGGAGGQCYRAVSGTGGSVVQACVGLYQSKPCTGEGGGGGGVGIY